MSVSMGDDQDVPCGDSDVLFAREANDSIAVGDQMIADQALGSGGKDVGDVLRRGIPREPCTLRDRRWRRSCARTPAPPIVHPFACSVDRGP